MFLCFFPLFFLNILFPASSQAPAQPELAFCTADNNQKGVLSLPEAKGTIGVCEGRGETSPPARHLRAASARARSSPSSRLSRRQATAPCCMSERTRKGTHEISCRASFHALPSRGPSTRPCRTSRGLARFSWWTPPAGRVLSAAVPTPFPQLALSLPGHPGSFGEALQGPRRRWGGQSLQGQRGAGKWTPTLWHWEGHSWRCGHLLEGADVRHVHARSGSHVTQRAHSWGDPPSYALRNG